MMMTPGNDQWITIHYDGEPYKVPSGRTIVTALETAGVRFVRSVGCRGGVCGACTAFYRTPADAQLKSALMCQEQVVDGMSIMPMPFFPQNQMPYTLNLPAGVSPARQVMQLYPEVGGCIMCQECTRICPVGIDVMGYVGMIKRGDLKAAAEASFTCVQCQACAVRCPARISQPNAALAARRFYGAHVMNRADHLQKARDKAKSQEIQRGFRRLKRMDAEELKNLYQRREVEPAQSAPGTWLPEDTTLLG
ncbi:ferredoxin [Magnetococcus marinus MC-1]|uniref:Ferredoxin n=1 Tax=Magnetococcus marinus (strain ATCC BAA-1437 / JCM 17883 / MC-1) TaxID=156889 RepID=A0L8G0_MAGMM|nr:4Fe-4S dicluster domain-containing protein [Magnetococcus marinus]ABK44253.1 ferredoxin [Magnetococcus marinus MC-1]